jgi:hypothetical protein
VKIYAYQSKKVVPCVALLGPTASNTTATAGALHRHAVSTHVVATVEYPALYAACRFYFLMAFLHAYFLLDGTCVKHYPPNPDAYDEF